MLKLAIAIGFLGLPTSLASNAEGLAPKTEVLAPTQDAGGTGGVTKQTGARKVEGSKAAPAKSAKAEGAALAAIDAFIAKQDVDTEVENWRTKLVEPPKATFAEGENYIWKLDTNKGPIKVRLMSKVAPMHVTSTIYLTRLGFYDNTVFHRVIPGFMAQGGCPLGNGRGGPGYKYDGEYDPEVKHDRPGLLSMANTGRPKTDGSQFFLTFVPTPHLDGKHTIFGEVIEGMETVQTLEKSGSRSGKTSERLVIEKATILTE